jgi:hypothetical protein
MFFLRLGGGAVAPPRKISEKHRETSNVSEIAGNIFASSREANFISETMFARVGKQGNI